MIEDKKTNKSNSIFLTERSHLELGGVTDCLSFDEESVVCDTVLGTLCIRGADLHINKINLDTGELVIDGEIDMLEYVDYSTFGKKKASFLNKLFK